MKRKSTVRAIILALLCVAVLTSAATAVYSRTKSEQLDSVNAAQVLSEDSYVSSEEEASETQSSMSENISFTGEKNIGNVPIIAQHPEFPTGCESVSTVMVLKFLGENITVGRFVDELLPKSNEFYNRDGKRYGPSPYEYFIGSPRSSSSYGCMASVIEKAVSNYYGSSERVKNTTGTSLVQLCKDYIDNDIPVIVWATISMIEVKPTSSWYLSDETLFTWPGNEHCLVLTGYDNNYYYFNDPYKGAALKYARSRVENRFAALGKQSVVIMPK